MACSTCGSSILFGGKKAGSRKYCSKKCLNADEVGRISDSVTDNQVDDLVVQIRGSACPSCKNEGGLEMFKSYFVYSVIILTSWKEKPELSCKPCAKKRQIKDLFASFFLGWWGIPFGLIVTPIILIMNGVALIVDPSKKHPSKAIKERARLLIAQDILTTRKNAQQGQ